MPPGLSEGSFFLALCQMSDAPQWLSDRLHFNVEDATLVSCVLHNRINTCSCNFQSHTRTNNHTLTSTHMNHTLFLTDTRVPYWKMRNKIRLVYTASYYSRLKRRNRKYITHDIDLIGSTLFFLLSNHL